MFKTDAIALSSPSGSMSKRSRGAAQARIAQQLFPNGFPQPTCEQPTQRDYLLRNAAMLRDLAARGMHPRSYLKRAIQLETAARAMQKEESK